MACSSSTVATTAAAPAVYAKQRPVGKLSQAFAVLVVAPMTVRRARAASVRVDLEGKRGVVRAPAKGEMETEGVSLMLAPSAGLTTRGWEGVSDMALVRSTTGGVRAGESRRARAAAYQAHVMR
jgi:hypothetical protein